MTLPPAQLNPPESKLESASKLIKRFSVGAVVGLIIAASQWSGYTYFGGEPQGLTRNITFCLVISIICGLMTLKWGYKTLENLFQLLG